MSVRTDRLGVGLLAVWLIAAGLQPLLGMSHVVTTTALSLLAIAAGVVLLLADRR